MKKYLVIFLVLITSYASAITIAPSSWNLGTIANNTGVQKLKLEIYNDTQDDIKIDFISTCDCLVSDTGTINISSNETAYVTFHFDPIDENGTISKFMIIRTTQPGLPKALFEVYGEISGDSENTGLKINEEESDKDQIISDQSLTNIPIKYYYSAGCVSCRKFLNQTIPKLEEKFGISIKVEELNILNSDIYEDYFSRLKQKELETIKFPSIFIGDTLLQGDKAIADNLEQELLNFTGENRNSDNIGLIGDVSISLIPVLLAGLLDGINPCVFTTLLFLISSLTLAGRGRKEILFIGIFFSLAVFITYYLVGLGLFQGLRSASVFPFIAEIIKYFLVFFLVLISIFSFYDFIQIKKGKVSEISLQLPKFLKLKIHSIIRGQAKSTSIIIGSLVLGVMVSIFELACTGQVYFPTIAYLVKLNQGSAYFYLAIYNISFIIPLFIVFILIYKGTGSKAITIFFKNNMGVMKIGLSLLFLVLAGVVFLL